MWYLLEGSCPGLVGEGLVHWRLQNAQNQVLGEGQVECSFGKLEIRVLGVDFLCGASHSVQAQMGEVEPVQKTIEIPCEK